MGQHCGDLRCWVVLALLEMAPGWVLVLRGSASVETDFGGSTVIGSCLWNRCLRFLL